MTRHLDESAGTLSRRRLLGLLALAIAVLPTTGVAQGQQGGQRSGSGQDARGAGTRRETNSSAVNNPQGNAKQIRVVDLDPNSPNAVALGYNMNHQQVDTRRWVKKSKDTAGAQRCATCALYRSADASGGSCSIFSGKRVAANGWCNAWTGH